eukprot:Transcript_27212.p1 GENE.Transcript_27212~~Transcript_27212.p1  ORF type:complete len:426 (+),score=127.26 Transcript_27212:47-1279(+)
MSHVGPAAVWPTRSWPLSALTPAQWASWERDGYLIIPDVINASTAVAAGTAIRAFIGANDSDPATWYANTLDIYEDRTPTGARPHHGPCGMVNLCHHQALWDIRQEPRLHRVFADLYGTPRLYVTTDRQHFKPPQHAAFPAWSDPGAVHKGLHWDVDTRRNNWPVPYVVQGVVYLEETTAEQGALRVVPGFHRRLAAWDAEQPADRGAERPEGDAAAALDAEAVALAAGAGSLVVWHSLLPHGPAPNLGAAPRVSSYVTMLPVDAGPFLGPSRPADTPLGLADAGTLSYLLELQDKAYPDGAPEAAEAGGAEAEAADAAGGGGDEGGCSAGGGGEAGKPGLAVGRPRRQSRERRAERWRWRLPLLDEDPRESELPHLVPGEEDGRPARLTPLGERLAGLVEWEADGEIRA